MRALDWPGGRLTTSRHPLSWLPPWRDHLSPAGMGVFFVVAPVLVGLMLGWNRMGVGPYMTRGASTLYWTGLAFAVWIAATVGTVLVHAVAARRRRWPLWAVALAGAVIGMALFYWPIARYRHFGLSFIPAGFGGPAPPLPWPTLDYLPKLIANTLPGVAYWTAAAWIVSRLFARQPDGPVATATAAPDMPVAMHAAAHVEAALRARLPAHLDAEILALKAEDHYVRVYTARGDTLVHYRFRDAVRGLASADGLQVHRSFWVRRSAITRHCSEGHSQFLHLVNGLKVPVSRSYLNSLRQSGTATNQASANR